MRNRISWLIACQSVCAGTDGIRKGWGGNHEAPSPFALGGVALGPKGIACVHTYAHTRREAESDGGTRVRMRKCARTYVLRGRLLSLSAVRAHTMHVRTDARACVRQGRGHARARTHRTYARKGSTGNTYVGTQRARTHKRTQRRQEGRRKARFGGSVRIPRFPQRPRARARKKKNRGLRIAFPCKSSPQDFLPQQACPTAAEAEAASAKSLADGLFFAGTRQSTSESTSMGAGGAGSSACRRSGSSGGQLP